MASNSRSESSTNPSSSNSFNSRSTLKVGENTFEIHRVNSERLTGLGRIDKLPYSIKVVLENLLRHEDGHHVSADDIVSVASWADRVSASAKVSPSAEPSPSATSASPQSLTTGREIAFTPERVLMQDFTGVPAVVDLGAMRDAVMRLGGDPSKINPLVPVELVIDHSVIAERSGNNQAYESNVDIEYQRNMERYQLLRWAQGTFDGFRVVPPGTGICHQVNLEYLSRVVFATNDGRAFCDTLVGTDSHTTMVNGLGVLGWGVGGIEAEAAMLGQPLTMLLPAVVGLRLFGEPVEGTTATDVVLTITELLRSHGVVGKFVECFGPGIAALPLETRATIGNMTPEYGATCTIFPIDQSTIDYLRFTGRDAEHLHLVEAYAKEQGMWHEPAGDEPVYSEIVELDLGTVVPSLAGPSRPQDRVSLPDAGTKFKKALGHDPSSAANPSSAAPEHRLTDGDVVIAAITSCTNTSNPQVLVAAGLLAKKAVERGLSTKPWVKTTLAPGSRVVMDYLERAELIEPLDQLGFYLVGFGCTTCIGNSGPLLDGISNSVKENDLSVVSVLSGNRNFEGRIHPDVRMNYLASPPLVVAFALAGTINIDLSSEPIGLDHNDDPVYLADLWPSAIEINETIRASLTAEMFAERYSCVFDGDERWKNVPVVAGETFAWDPDSTYVKNPPFFTDLTMEPNPLKDIEGARVLAVLGDSVTTDHISPAGSINPNSPAGHYLRDHNVDRNDFNSYGARRGNHEIMMRGTFANTRLRNKLAPGTEGGITLELPIGNQAFIYDAAMNYADAGIPLVILAGKEYGSGSSRDWAAKGTALLGVRAVIAESYERIHRSNLVGMGVLPLEFTTGESANSLGLSGHETFTIHGISGICETNLVKSVVVEAKGEDGEVTQFDARVRIDTPVEAEYYRHGGILPYVVRQLAN